MGTAHYVRRRARVQPAELPPWFRMAARQFTVRAWHGAQRVSRAGDPCFHKPLPGRTSLPRLPPARIVLWRAAPRLRRSRALPGLLLAAEQFWQAEVAEAKCGLE